MRLDKGHVRILTGSEFKLMLRSPQGILAMSFLAIYAGWVLSKLWGNAGFINSLASGSLSEEGTIVMAAVKWLANIAGVALIIGSFLLIQKRRAQTDQLSSYADWFLLGFVFTVAVSGLLAEITRFAGWAGITYTVYFIHLVAVWVLIAFLPFSKLAHLVYRTVAMAYDKYIDRH